MPEYENPEIIEAIDSALRHSTDDELDAYDQRNDRTDEISARLSVIRARLAELEHAQLYGALTREQRRERDALHRERGTLEDEQDDHDFSAHGPRRGTPQWKAMRRRDGDRDRPFRWVTETSAGLPTLGKRK